MKSILKYINGFSLDVALGAVVFSNSLAFYFDKALPLQVSVLLFCAVWVIYTLDHLLDAKSIRATKVSFRHNLHALYNDQLKGLIGAVTLISIFTLFLVDESFIWLGLLLALAISLYLYLNNKYSIYAKELIVALGYTFGVMLGSIVVLDFELSLTHLFLSLQVFLVAFLNLIIFAVIEFDQDRESGFSSLAVYYGKIATSKIVFLLFVLFFTIQVFFVYFDTFLISDPLQMVLFMMVLSLVFIFHQKEKLADNSLYRFLGDGIFFLPGLIFFFK